MIEARSYIGGDWHMGAAPQVLRSAVTGEPVAQISSQGINFKEALNYGRKAGAKLRGMSFHDRARMLKALALYLGDRKAELYKVSTLTGATKTDSWIDIDGGIGTTFVFASKGRREFPDAPFYIDGPTEAISKAGTFVGRHLCVPLEGVALHINAFNFPCWGMLEKIACNLLAGMPAIVKPASATAYLTHVMVRQIIDSKILPEGALQLICGSIGDTFDHLSSQDVVTFTGSAETARKLRTHPAIVENSIRFNVEADSLNCSILGPGDKPGSAEFDLYVKEVAREMTVKAGQKCTAIRRAIVPEGCLTEVMEALKKRLAGVTMGDPGNEAVRMGPLVSREQLEDVSKRVVALRKTGELICGDPANMTLVGADSEKGAFLPPTLLYCKDPWHSSEPHTIEAFGPVSTVMAYKTPEEAIELAKLGRGSLVGSIITADDNFAREVSLGVASHHGRLVLINKDSAAESTGHGSPLAHLVHGGPGRAGGGEEMGGVRGVLHYMQRSAVQGSPTTLMRVFGEHIKGAKVKQDSVHPFKKYFEELEIGETLVTGKRTITEADIIAFAKLSGDFFYAHMDDEAARGSIFDKRVAHGYFIIGAAAGLFVDPAPGPVLANYGLENLRFTKPVYIGDSIYVKLACKSKIVKETPKDGIPQGVIAWDVEVINQNEEPVALYSILTLVKRRAT